LMQQNLLGSSVLQTAFCRRFYQILRLKELSYGRDLLKLPQQILLKSFKSYDTRSKHKLPVRLLPNLFLIKIQRIICLSPLYCCTGTINSI
jgi:hypothetical protein